MLMSPPPAGNSESLNHKAYDDVCCALDPTMPENAMYMDRYRFWRGIAGETHFDPHYSESDGF
ncbi:hypothetical protein JZU46_06290 [bacterium]|nr:hypothetical protein [bacterium]